MIKRTQRCPWEQQQAAYDVIETKPDNGTDHQTQHILPVAAESISVDGDISASPFPST